MDVLSFMFFKVLEKDVLKIAWVLKNFLMYEMEEEDCPICMRSLKEKPFMQMCSNKHRIWNWLNSMIEHNENENLKCPMCREESDMILNI